MNQIKAPLPMFNDLSGLPLNDGNVYFGVINQNPETNPITIYWDIAGTQPASQPIKVLNGVPYRDGNPANIFCNGAYSVTVKNKNGSLVYYNPNFIVDASQTDVDLFKSTSGAGLIGVLDSANNFSELGSKNVENVLAALVARLYGFNLAKLQGVDITGVADSTAAIAAAIASGKTLFYAPAGTYSITGLSLLGKNITIVGDGMGKTIFKARTGSTVMFDAAESADVIISPFCLKSMSIDGNSIAQTCLDVRFRHFVCIEDVIFSGATVQNVKAKDTWLMCWIGGGTMSSPIGLFLVGSNHRSKFDSVNFQNCTGTHLKITQAGTALDGNDALSFNNCDIEFGSGVAAYIDATSVSFNDCYLGENISSNVIQALNGIISINGGCLFYGYTTNSNGFVPSGGKIVVRNVRINGQTNASFNYLINGGGGKIAFYDCSSSTPLGGVPTIANDVLDWGPQGVVYAERLGKNWTGQGNNVSFSTVLSGTWGKWTVTAAPGPTPLLGTRSALINNTKWRDGGNAYLVINYESSQPIEVALSGGAFGVTPKKSFGVYPATSGASKTIIKLDVALDAAAYTILEITQTASGVNDYIALYDCCLADERMLNKTVGSFGNLYKC